VSLPWFTVKKGAVGVHVMYAHGGTDLLIENFAVRPDDPFDVRLDLSKNLRTRNKTENSYVDAVDVSNNIDSLKSVQINDETILKGVSKHIERALKTQGQPKRVRLCVLLKGEHWYEVQLTIPNEYTLMLEVVSA